MGVGRTTRRALITIPLLGISLIYFNSREVSQTTSKPGVAEEFHQIWDLSKKAATDGGYENSGLNGRMMEFMQRTRKEVRPGATKRLEMEATTMCKKGFAALKEARMK